MPEAAAAPQAPVASVGGYRWDLDVLRVAAILGVVAIHVFGLILGREDLRGTQTWTFGVILDIGAIWCVPVFVMISGALLLAPRAHAAGPGTFLRKRAVRLLPALLVWHLVYLVPVRRWMFEDDSTLSEIVVQVFDTKVYTALYFLWLILGLYLVAPVLAAFLAGGGRRRAAVTALVACTWSAAVLALPGISAQLDAPRSRPENFITMFLPYVGLFVAGYACREPRRTGGRWLWTGLVAVALLAEAIWQYDARPDPAWLQAVSPVGYYGALVMVASVCLFVSVTDLCARIRLGERAQRVLRTLGEATFGVFLVHLVFVAVARRWFEDFYLDPSPVAKTQLYLAVVVAAFAVAIVARRIPVLRRVF